MSSFQTGDVWLLYEQSGLHEEDRFVLQELDVLMPELAGADKDPYPVAGIQKYVTKDDKIRWRSLTSRRNVFRGGYESRERCAQELVKECPSIVQIIAWRRARIAREASASLQTD